MLDPSFSQTLARRQRIVQIHPTRRCNLRCAHCYSTSGPDAPAGLDADVLCDALTDARSLGFETVAFAGGEPLVYPELGRVLRHAQEIGLRTTVTTNGTQFRTARFDAAVPFIDALAVSIDGPPDVHNKVRVSPTAFDRLEKGLEVVTASDVPFGIITTLFNGGWDDVEWVGRYAARAGARLFQIHPLELSGRALHGLQAAVPAHLTRGRAYLLAAHLREIYGDTMLVHLDLLHRADLIADPEQFYAGEAGEVDLPADELGNVALQEDGTVVPIAHGFGPAYAIADVRRERLVDGWTRFAAQGLDRFRALCRDVHAGLTGPDGPQLVNWTEAVVAASILSPQLQLVRSTTGSGGQES